MEWMDTVRELAEDPARTAAGGGIPGNRPTCAARRGSVAAHGEAALAIMTRPLGERRHR